MTAAASPGVEAFSGQFAARPDVAFAQFRGAARNEIV
jgi:hypothetical protein